MYQFLFTCLHYTGLQETMYKLFACLLYTIKVINIYMLTLHYIKLLICSQFFYLHFILQAVQIKPNPSCRLILCPCFDQWAILVIYKKAGNCVELVYAPSDGERDDGVKQLVLFHPADETLNMDPQSSNWLCLSHLISWQLFPLRKVSRSVDFAGHTVINKKPFINHNGYSRFQQRHYARLL